MSDGRGDINNWSGHIYELHASAFRPSCTTLDSTPRYVPNIVHELERKMLLPYIEKVERQHRYSAVEVQVRSVKPVEQFSQQARPVRTATPAPTPTALTPHFLSTTTSPQTSKSKLVSGSDPDPSQPSDASSAGNDANTKYSDRVQTTKDEPFGDTK
ncbi:uncharacterized protein PV09_07482 [Verruconis gallopava]|uniref:Uncharacterized protein n=1 Tax=Verruconis gallopava TaxID=253628 RepID=A0A0D2A3H7_9PEZI|nr:uncharacterized protein PV09_07482 [Verruconis gallopava]KIW00960.1 hypothetical protein PV09_07482 [Verruconis gallopava]